MNDVLQKLENKVIALLDELEASRGKISALIKENQELRSEMNDSKGQSVNDQEKLQSILSLLDDVDTSSPAQPTQVHTADTSY